MRKITILFFMLISNLLFAQSPNQFSYQAVIRSANNQILTNQTVGIRLSIVKSNASGSIIYSETHSASTNQFGIVNLAVGAGSVINGNLSTIDWGSDIFFLKVDVDISGGTNYQFMGSSQLLSVPYALHASRADSITEADPIFGASLASGITPTDTTYWNNKLSSYTETDPIFSVSAASGITGNNITTWNNKLSSYTETDPIFGASVASGITGNNIASWNNKLSSYTETDPIFSASVASGITGNNISSWNSKLSSYTETDPVFNTSLAHGITSADTSNWNNKLATEVDGDVNNEIQTISRSGQTVVLSKGGGSFVDSVGEYSAGNGININNNSISVDLSSILPAGMIVPFAGDSSTVPNGWLLCDGSAVSRTTYANLFATIGINYGYGDAVSTFNLPDMRGRFLRGVDYGAGNDADTASRTATNGGNGGNEVGSVQDEAFKSHVHSVDPPNTYTNTTGNHKHINGIAQYYTSNTLFGVTSANTPYSTGANSSNGISAPYTSTTGNHSHAVNIPAFNSANSGGSETRPKNIYVNYIIKY